MRLLPLAVLLVALACVEANVCAASSPPRPLHVRIEHHLVELHPDLVLSTHRPVFDWQLAAEFSADGVELRGVSQVAYRLLLLRDSRGLLWDSGRVESDQSVQAAYDGPVFASDSSYEWRLQYWSSSGALSAWAEGRFRTALFAVADWHGGWIGSDRLNMNALRRVFTLPSDARRATLFYCGLGYSELWLDGLKVDPSRVLDPGWTNYHKRSLYVSLDLTAQLTAGDHALGVLLGDGWYSRQPGLWDDSYRPANITHGPPRLLLQLNVELSDGSRWTLHSDAQWRGRQSENVAAAIYQGQVIDRRLARSDWCRPGSDDEYSPWLPVDVLPSPLASGGRLSLQMMDPIRKGDAGLHIRTSQAGGGQKLRRALIGADIRQRVLRPLGDSSWQFGNVLDLGQNMVGWCSLNATLPRGSSVYVRYAEYRLQPTSGPTLPGSNVDIEQANLRGIAVEDVWLVNGSLGDGETELLEPSMTYHGFRYINIHVNTGWPAAAVSCPVVHSETSLVGNFSTDNDVINQLQQNVLWTQLGNSMSVITDCPQRQERRGWTGDAGGSVDLSLYMFDYANLYRHFLLLISDEQDNSTGRIPVTIPHSCCDSGRAYEDPNWNTAYSTIVWALYDHYGDTASMAQHYDGLELLFNGVYSSWYHQHGLRGFFGDYFDWLAQPDGVTDSGLVSAYAFLHDCVRLARMSDVLGMPDKAAHYNATYRALAKEFHTTWFNASTGGYANNAQTANALALALPDLVPAELRAGVANNLVADLQAKGHFTVGIIGMQQLFAVLSDNGHHDVAVQLVSSTAFPSFGWTFNNGRENATTMWEEFAPPDDSHSMNHHMFSSVASWLYRSLGGVQLNALQRIVVQPRLQHDHALLSSVHLELHTSKGLLRSAWESQWQQRALSMNVTVPLNARARIVLECPVKGGRWAELRLNGAWMLRRGAWRHERVLSAAAGATQEHHDGVSAWRELQDGSMELEVGSGVFCLDGSWT